MKWHRIVAVIVRHIYNFRHSADKVFDAFYWPVMDILLWGLTSKYILETGEGLPNLAIVLLSGLIFWQVVWRSQYEITTNFLEELWSRNMVNFFATPLKLREWVVGVLLLGVLKMAVTLSFVSILTYLLYAVNILSVGLLLVPFFGLLLVSGWWVGFLVSGLIVSFGTRIQTLAWAGVYLLAPFSAIYYPVSVLPEWAQMVAKFVPMSYVFEGMRVALSKRTFSIEHLLISFGLNVVYLLLAMLFFVKLFNKRKVRGFSQLE